MPLEIKHIYFTESELRKALVNFSVLNKKHIRLEDIQESIVDSAESVQVSFLVDRALQLENNTVIFSNSEVAAALLAFCMVSKIPLPRKGIKELHANDEKIYLKIQLDQEINFEKYNINNMIQNSSGAHNKSK
ncbi:MAG: hypothetical protein L3J58_06080 [Emcibacter sp.]|nr:hypothetical protein [Emcibacter sp.]